MRGTLLAIVMFVTLCPLATSAAPPTPEAKAKARAAYLRAREHHDAGRYEEAVVELKRAYALVPFSVLLRYIADSYDAMKRYPLALKYYRLYLERARYAQDKAGVGRRVRELEESLNVEESGPKLAGERVKLPPELIPSGRDAELPADLAPPPPPASAPVVSPAPPRQDRGLGGRIVRVAKWSALGVGVAALAVGVTFNVLARSKARELEDNVRAACPNTDPGCGGNPGLSRPVTAYTPEQYDLEQTYLRYRNRSIGFFIGAGAAAAAAAVLFVLDWPRGGGPRVSVSGGRSGVTLGAEASF